MADNEIVMDIEGSEPVELEMEVDDGGGTELEMAVAVGDVTMERTAEAWATGERNGVPVAQDDPTYHNNSKYYAEQTREELNRKADMIECTLPSQEVAEFTDGGEDFPMKVKCSMLPVQDLHGYDRPWAAGQGKNIFPGFDRKSASTVRSKKIYVDFATNQYYIFSGLGATINCYCYAYESDATFVGRNLGSKRTTMKVQKTSFSAGDGSQEYDSIAYLEFIFYNVSDDFGVAEADAMPIQFEVGETATSYEPYANVCPITGYDECTVTVTSLNLFDKNNADEYLGYPNNSAGVVTSNSTHTSVIIPCKPNTTYTVSKTAVANVDRLVITWTKEYPTAGTAIYGYKGKSSDFTRGYRYSYSLTTGEDAEYLFIWATKTVDKAASYETLQVNEGGIIPYVRYGESHTITFPTPPGTVYGGSLYIYKDGAGAIYVSQMSKTFTGTESSGWTAYDSGSANNYYRYKMGSKGYMTANKGLCSHYTRVSINSSTTNIGFNIGNSDTTAVGSAITFRPDLTIFPTLTSFKTYLQEQYNAGTPVQVVYTLGAEVRYDITAEQVKSILGYNKVQCSAGDVLLIYTADTKLYIEKLTQPAEDDLVANANIPNATFFMVNNDLYLSTQAIAQGADIVPGTNCTKLSLADALNNLNQ